jgi:hypothetical protein
MYPYDDFDFSDEERELEELKECLAECENVIAENRDDRPKEVGDRVKVWDGSSLTDIHGNERYVIEPPFTIREYFIVISIHQDEMYRDEYEANQDLIIANPETKEKFRVSSDGVRIID